MFNAMKVDVNIHSNLLPWLGDYTHPWTDNDLYVYFNLSDDEIKIIEDEIKMKFDCIIMNPPYCRNLHLKILNEAIHHSDDIVNLSPIRWLQDPLAEYKRNSDWKKFENIRNHIENIDIIKVTDAETLFGISLPFNLGVYHITKDGGWINTFNKPLLSKMVEKVISTDNVETVP